MGKNKVKDPNKLGIGRLLAFKSSDVAAAWINLITLNYLSIYCSDTLGISVATVGTMLMVSKIIDAITDIFAGMLVDNTHTKLGKGRPYELCIIGMTVCTVLLFSGNPAWSNTVKCVWIFFMYVMLFAVFATLRNAAATPYTIRAFSNNPVLIKKVASYGGIITMAGSMAMNIAFPILMARLATSAGGWRTLMLIIMIPATLIAVCRFIFIKEDPTVDEQSKQEPINLKEIFTLFRRNPYVWLYALIMLCYNLSTNLSIGVYFYKYIVGNVALQALSSVISIVMLPVMLTFPAIMKRIGSMGKMIFVFSIISAVGCVVVFISGGWLPGVLAGSLVGAMAGLPIAYYGVLFIMNICTYNEMIGLPRMDGSSGILSGFASKVGGAMGAWLTGILLSLSGYISSAEEVVQPDSALMMIRVENSLVPLILTAIIGICSLAFAGLEAKAAAFEAEKKAAAASATENVANA